MRWQATVHYRTEHGTADVIHDMEELADIHDLIERGPHWDTIQKIEIFRINHCSSEALTVEQAEKM